MNSNFWPKDGIVIEFSSILIALIVIIALAVRLQQSIGIKDSKTGREEIVLAFFHPHCDSGGGGERVLWVIIDALLQDESLGNKLKICIYCAKAVQNKSQILQGVENNFRINVEKHSSKISFVHIQTATLLDAKWYLVATMLCQSLGSVIVGLECILRRNPDIYCDTMGAAFTYPLAKLLFGCHVVAYTHYPIISTDMLQQVRDQRPNHNNSSSISSSISISTLKLVYYKIFAHAYTFVGSFADKVMVNSTWTANHISQLWKLDFNIDEDQLNRNSALSAPMETSTASHRLGQKLFVVYPPCNTAHLQEIALGDEVSRKRVILSIGQFRPEKDHLLQLKVMRALLDTDDRYGDVKLVMVGSTRNEIDRDLVLSLRAEAEVLEISDNVIFVVDATFTDLHGWLRKAQIGLHTMWNEHFGISVVEMMAAGLLTVAHNSGGPKMDLIVPVTISNSLRIHQEPNLCTGYLATTATEYADCIGAALDSYAVSLPLRQRARNASRRFSDSNFMTAVGKIFSDIIK